MSDAVDRGRRLLLGTAMSVIAGKAVAQAGATAAPSLQRM